MKEEWEPHVEAEMKSSSKTHVLETIVEGNM